MEVQTHNKASDADGNDLRIAALAEQVWAMDWATLGAHVLEAATIANATRMAEEARRLAITGSVVEPPMDRAGNTT